MNSQPVNIQEDMGFSSNKTSSTGRFSSDDEFQDYLLQGVSRTFALTIPQLPNALRKPVSNAYLLCRLIDTIEDETSLDLTQKKQFADMFVSVVEGGMAAKVFSGELSPLLSSTTIAEEHELVTLTKDVVRITHSFTDTQQEALSSCVKTMARGMMEFQEATPHIGLVDMPHMDQYCYYVAGVVGEMLTKLFCEYSDEIAVNRDTLLKLSVSFGQGLQMTNILKDIWDDYSRGACWLPRSVFEAHGYSLDSLASSQNNKHFEAALSELIAIAHTHLKNALQYTLLIPPHETGIRKFCLWALGMAVLTLRKINRTRHFTSGTQVKITRRSVKTTIITTNLLVRRDPMLKLLFNLSSAGIPNNVQ